MCSTIHASCVSSLFRLFFFFLRSSFLSFLLFELSSRSSTHRRKNDTYPAWIRCTDIFAEVFSKRKCLNNNCSVKRSAEFRVLGYLESIIRSGNIVLKAIILKFLKREERGMVNKEIARLDRFNNLQSCGEHPDCIITQRIYLSIVLFKKK